jgi:O-antigen ligase
VWGLFGIFSNITSFPEKFGKSERKNQLVLLFQILPFIMILLSYFFIDSSKLSGFAIEKSLSFLFIPFTFFIQKEQLTLKHLSIVFLVLGMSMLLMFIKGIIGAFLDMNAIIKAAEDSIPINSYTEIPHFQHQFRIAYAKYSGIHPTYSNIIMGICVIAFVYFIPSVWKELSLLKKLFFSMLFLTGLTCMFVVTSRMPRFATFLGIGVIMIQQIGIKKVLMFGPIGVVSIFILAYSLNPSFKAKIDEVSVDNVKMPTEKSNDSFNVRTGIVICAISGIKENWLLGVGAGGSEEYLNTCYENFDSPLYAENRFNTHNQYFDSWLSYGIFGLLSLLLLFLSSIYVAIRKKILLGFVLILFFSICVLTENVLSRQVGIVSFSLLNSFLLFIKEEDSVSNEL